MSTLTQEHKTNGKAFDSKQLESLIDKAIKKVNAKKENDICRFIPSPKGGYIHHFSMKKMKHENPEQLASWISKWIIQSDTPQKVTPKSRAPRGSRKRRDHLPLSKQDIDTLVLLCRRSGEKDIARKLTPKKDLKTIKRELIASIKHSEVREDLWHSYADIVTHPAGAANPA
jgi:hypothetical protein